MIVYLFKNKNLSETIHRIKSEGGLELHDSMSIYIKQSLYIISGKPKLHIFKEYNINVYEVEVSKITDELEDDYNEDILNDIQDYIRETKINNIVN